MPWYRRTIYTVAVDDADTTETEQMWRQIDPVVYYKMRRVVQAIKGRPTGVTP